MKLNRRTFFKLIGAAVTVLAAPKFVEARLSKHIVVEPKVISFDMPMHSNGSMIVRQFVGKDVVCAKSYPASGNFDFIKVACDEVARNNPDFVCVHNIGIGMGLQLTLRDKGYAVVGCSGLDRDPEKREAYKTYFPGNYCRGD